MTPTQRTLAALRNEGCYAGIVERFNAYVGPNGIRQDLFGFVDLIAIYPDERGITAVQCTGQHGHPAHRAKIMENEIAPEWLRAGGRIELWSWRKVKLKRGGTAVRWRPRVEVFSIQDGVITGEELEWLDS